MLQTLQCANCWLRIFGVERGTHSPREVWKSIYVQYWCRDLDRVLTTLPPPSLPTPAFAIRCHPAIVGEDIAPLARIRLPEMELRILRTLHHHSSERGESGKEKVQKKTSIEAKYA